ncbi:hypothetical protein SAMN05414139_04531 [Burkholderia sp. D7]|nr:hypothetical protein SAMN05414139_04531 [Burkholderia sp. D7]
MLSFEKNRSEYDRSVETLTPKEVFEEVSDPQFEGGASSVQPSVPA